MGNKANVGKSAPEADNWRFANRRVKGGCEGVRGTSVHCGDLHVSGHVSLNILDTHWQVVHCSAQQAFLVQLRMALTAATPACLCCDACVAETRVMFRAHRMARLQLR